MFGVDPQLAVGEMGAVGEVEGKPVGELVGNFVGLGLGSCVGGAVAESRILPLSPVTSEVLEEESSFVLFPPSIFGDCVAATSSSPPVDEEFVCSLSVSVSASCGNELFFEESSSSVSQYSMRDES